MDDGDNTRTWNMDDGDNTRTWNMDDQQIHEHVSASSVVTTNSDRVHSTMERANTLVCAVL
jgi:hypothetical protein